MIIKQIFTKTYNLVDAVVKLRDKYLQLQDQVRQLEQENAQLEQENAKLKEELERPNGKKTTARVKIKIAAEMFPEFRWVAARWKNKTIGWLYEEF